MKTIRSSVFETNSSSMHSITIVPEEEFEKFKKCELLLDYETLVDAKQEYKNVMDTLADWANDKAYNEQFDEEYKKVYKDQLTYERFLEVLRKFDYEDLSYYRREGARDNIEDDVTAVKAALSEDVYTFNTMGGGTYETYEERYTTKSGDKIVAFGYYGHDC